MHRDLYVLPCASKAPRYFLALPTIAARVAAVRLRAAASIFLAGLILTGASPASVLAESRPLTPLKFRFDAARGPYAVGLRVVEQYDRSRPYRSTLDALGKPFVGERDRPLQTLVWYPAVQSAKPKMTIRDYGNLWTTETTFERPLLTARAKETLEAMSATLSDSMWAVRDADEAPGRFPAVVYAPSFSNVSWENADLCEYLASNGYVVIASPALGVDTREQTFDVQGVTAQARDISFLVGYAETLRNVDPRVVAAAGFSMGGIANLVAAARDDRISALVAFDGVLRYAPDLIKQFGDVHPEKMTIPLLSFSVPFSMEDVDRYESGTVKPNAVNAWIKGDVVEVRMLSLFHDECSSMLQRNEDDWWIWTRLFRMLMGDSAREDGIAGYAWMSKYTLEFLNAYLKHDGRAVEFLDHTPADNGVPRHVMAVDYRRSPAGPKSLETFQLEVGRRGFARIHDVVEAARAIDPDFVIDDNLLNDWAEDLLDSGHPAEAIALLSVDVEMHPKLADAYVHLADAYRRTGQKALATANYKKALEKQVNDPFAVQGLHELDR